MDHNRSQAGYQNGSAVPSPTSVYSDTSDPKPLFARSGLTSSSRPTSRTSYTPSYMSMPRMPTPSYDDHNGRNNTATATVTPSKSTPAIVEPTSGALPGVLLVLIAGAFLPDLLTRLEVLLSRQPFSSIVVASTTAQEAALKQLKMDCYAVIGKLRKEMGVETYTHSQWEQADFEATVKQVTRNGASLSGVLCCPELAQTAEDIDILELEENSLYKAWTSSVAFIHSVSKATIRPLLSRCESQSNGSHAAPARQPRGPFFIVATTKTRTSLSQISKCASDALVLQLKATTKSQGLTVGFAEDILVPEAKREDEQSHGRRLPSLQTQDFNANGGDEAFAAGESPTKLYAMWALQDQLGDAD